MVQIFEVISGRIIANTSLSTQDPMANKFSFDLKTPGVNIGGEEEDSDSDNDERILMHDFHVVDMEKMNCQNELDEGISVRGILKAGGTKTGMSSGSLQGTWVPMVLWCCV